MTSTGGRPEILTDTKARLRYPQCLLTLPISERTRKLRDVELLEDGMECSEMDVRQTDEFGYTIVRVLDVAKALHDQLYI